MHMSVPVPWRYAQCIPPAWGDVSSPCAGTIVARGRHTSGDVSRATARYFFFSLFLLQSTLKVDFSVNRPPTAEIDRRRPILAVPPDSGGSAYRSAAGPVCTGRYGALPLGRENLG
ncbi:hypothetical protein BHM03_00027579 [Ensete ventricosum]|nr:hypothetical protein BHM03_00027579 [Ensete ventricosum]